MNENQTGENAVSVYGQEGLDDFPVLKAFQQYIDAEQNKARKRMVILCVFFGFLMTVVITVFLLVLMSVNEKNQLLNDRLAEKNQELNDRLVEYVMKNNEKQNVIVQQPAATPQNDAALKAVADSLAAMQKQIADQQAKELERQRAETERLREEAAKQKAPPPPTKEEIDRQKKIDADARKIAKATALLKAEKEKLAAEKEKLRQQEVELHRRRLYPEYYEKQDKTESEPKETKSQEPVAVNYFDAYKDDEDADFSYPKTDDDIDNLINSLPTPVQPERQTVKRIDPKPAAKPAAKPVAKPATKPVAKPAAKPTTKPAAKPAAKAEAKPTPTVKPVETKRPAQSADHFNVPLEINGEAGDWLIPTT